MKWFLFGLGTGIAIGVFTAPQACAKSRNEVGDRFRTWFGKGPQTQQADAEEPRVQAEEEAEAVTEF